MTKGTLQDRAEGWLEISTQFVGVQFQSKLKITMTKLFLFFYN